MAPLRRSPSRGPTAAAAGHRAACNPTRSPPRCRPACGPSARLQLPADARRRRGHATAAPSERQSPDAVALLRGKGSGAHRGPPLPSHQPPSPRQPPGPPTRPYMLLWHHLPRGHVPRLSAQVTFWSHPPAGAPSSARGRRGGHSDQPPKMAPLRCSPTRRRTTVAAGATKWQATRSKALAQRTPARARCPAQLPAGAQTHRGHRATEPSEPRSPDAGALIRAERWGHASRAAACAAAATTAEAAFRPTNAPASHPLPPPAGRAQQCWSSFVPCRWRARGGRGVRHNRLAQMDPLRCGPTQRRGTAAGLQRSPMRGRVYARRRGSSARAKPPGVARGHCSHAATKARFTAPLHPGCVKG